MLFPKFPSNSWCVFFIFSPPPFPWGSRKKQNNTNTHTQARLHTTSMVPKRGKSQNMACSTTPMETWPLRLGRLGKTSQVFAGDGMCALEEKRNGMNKLGMNGIKWSTPVGSLHHTLDTVTNKTTFSWKAPQTPNCLTSPSIRIVFLTWWNSFHMMDGLNYPGVFLIFHPKKKKNYPRESHLRPAVSRPPPCQCCGSTSGHGQVFNSAAEWANLWGCSEVGWRYPCSKTKNPRFFFAIPDFLGHKRWNI